MKPHIGTREIVYKNPFQLIYRVSVQCEHASKEVFVLACGRRVGIVAMRDHRVLLVRQHRVLARDLAWEIPGGKVEEDECLEKAAQREALEEGGILCRSLRPLLYFHPGLDTCDNPTFMFFADDCEDCEDEALTAKEVAERHWLPLEECIRMIFDGAIVDSLTVAALMALYIQLQNPQFSTVLGKGLWNVQGEP